MIKDTIIKNFKTCYPPYGSLHDCFIREADLPVKQMITMKFLGFIVPLFEIIGRAEPGV